MRSLERIRRQLFLDLFRNMSLPINQVDLWNLIPPEIREESPLFNERIGDLAGTDKRR
jgi:hypothetical protein